MPPKARFTKQEIQDCAFQILREKGAEGVTARELGAKLNASSRPVFTAYTGMEELKEELFNRALEAYEQSLLKSLYYTLPYKRAGMEMFNFSVRESELFRFLFFEKDRNRDKTGENLYVPEKLRAQMIASVSRDFAIGSADAMTVVGHLIGCAFSLCCRQAIGLDCFEESEVQDILGREITAMVMLAKTGKLSDPTMPPVYRGKKENT